MRVPSKLFLFFLFFFLFFVYLVRLQLFGKFPTATATRRVRAQITNISFICQLSVACWKCVGNDSLSNSDRRQRRWQAKQTRKYIHLYKHTHTHTRGFITQLLGMCALVCVVRICERQNIKRAFLWNSNMWISKQAHTCTQLPTRERASFVSQRPTTSVCSSHHHQTLTLSHSRHKRERRAGRAAWFASGWLAVRVASSLSMSPTTTTTTVLSFCRYFDL